MAKLQLLSAYWSYRSFRAELLPSVTLSGNLMNFDRSMTSVRNYENGKVNYVEDNQLSNNLSLSISQNIPLTGGTVSLESYVYRLDEFNYDLTTYYSQPFRITYTQPLRSYNTLRWQQKTEPLELEKAKKVYLETMEDVACQCTALFFNVLSAQSSYKENESNFLDRTQLMTQAGKRFQLGTLNKSELLQLELSQLNAKVQLNQSGIDVKDARFQFFSYLLMVDYGDVELVAPVSLPEIILNVDEVVAMALENSSHNLEQRLDVLESEQELAEAKSARGIQLSLSASLGMNKTAYSFTDVYRQLDDNEVVGVTLSLPIFDWGVSKGRVQVAKANLEVVKTEVEQANLEFIQDLRKRVLQFNSQGEQCRNAQRAVEIAEERYGITKRRFENGSISVTDLNTAWQEMQSARSQFIDQIETYWTQYYALRKLTLHDFSLNAKIDVDFDCMFKEFR